MLDKAALSKDDISHLTRLFGSNNLSQLKQLHLKSLILCNMEDGMEDELGELINACVTHQKRELILTMYGNNLSKEFKEKWGRCCEGTKIELGF